MIPHGARNQQLIACNQCDFLDCNIKVYGNSYNCRGRHGGLIRQIDFPSARGGTTETPQ
jgi:hypothetical protein